MKKTLGLFLALGLLAGACDSDSESDIPEVDPIPERRTPIPDSNFEQALVDRTLDDAVDGSVLTSRIAGIARLDVQGEGIADLTGIEDFAALTDLNVRDNELEQLDISANEDLLFLWAENNQLTTLVLGNSATLEKVGASGNRLTTLSVFENTGLQLLNLADNALSAIDVSTLPLPSFNEFNIEGNPLTCILVSPEQIDGIPASWTKDEEDTYSLDCE
jgi:Leucine-rich repeat (LRR) protein